MFLPKVSLALRGELKGMKKEVSSGVSTKKCVSMYKDMSRDVHE